MPGTPPPEDPAKEGSLDVHGYDNVLTIDISSSKLSCDNVVNSSLVRIEKYKYNQEKELPPVKAHVQPVSIKR